MMPASWGDLNLTLGQIRLELRMPVDGDGVLDNALGVLQAAVVHLERRIGATATGQGPKTEFEAVDRLVRRLRQDVERAANRRGDSPDGEYLGALRRAADKAHTLVVYLGQFDVEELESEAS